MGRRATRALALFGAAFLALGSASAAEPQPEAATGGEVSDDDVVEVPISFDDADLEEEEPEVEEVELRERLTEREDQRRPEDPFSIDVFGRPLVLQGQVETLIELVDRVERGDSSRKSSRALSETELEVEAFYTFGPRLSLFAQVRLGYTKELASDSPDPISDFWVERGEMWLYSEDLLFPGFVFEIGRLNYEDDRRWWWDADLDAVRTGFENDTFEILVSAAFELGASDSSLGYVEVEDDDVFRVLGEASWEWWPDQAIELFALHQNDDSGVEKVGALVKVDREDDSDGDLTWIGGRLMGATETSSGAIFGYWLDAAGVFGRERLVEFDDFDRRRSVVEGSSRQDVNGFGIDLGVTWIAPLPCEPRATLGYAYGSGDSDPFNGSDGSFRQTGIQSNEAGFGGVRSFASYGFLLDPELSNLHVLTADVGVSVFDASSIDLAFHWYRQVKAVDFLRNTNLDTDLTGRSRDVGIGFDVVMAIQEWSWLELDVVASAFRAGNAFGKDRHRWSFGGLLGVTVVF